MLTKDQCGSQILTVCRYLICVLRQCYKNSQLLQRQNLFQKLSTITNMTEWLCMSFCYLHLEVICIYIHIEMQGFVLTNICN